MAAPAAVTFQRRPRIAFMTTLRILILGGLIASAVLTASPGRADTAAAKPTAAPQPTLGDQWNSAGGLPRIIATSAGVLAGAGAMSIFIDGWVVDAFMGSSGLTSREAYELVQDFDSQSGFEAAAVVLAGLAGGLFADGLYVKGAAVLPGVLESIDASLQPPLAAVGGAWASSTGWLRDRAYDTSDWFQNRAHELQDRWQLWGERLGDSAAPPPSRPLRH